MKKYDEEINHYRSQNTSHSEGPAVVRYMKAHGQLKSLQELCDKINHPFRFGAVMEGTIFFNLKESKNKVVGKCYKYVWDDHRWGRHEKYNRQLDAVYDTLRAYEPSVTLTIYGVDKYEKIVGVVANRPKN